MSGTKKSENSRGNEDSTDPHILRTRLDYCPFLKVEAIQMTFTAFPMQKGTDSRRSLLSTCSQQQDLLRSLVFLCNKKVPSFKLSFICHWAWGRKYRISQMAVMAIRESFVENDTRTAMQLVRRNPGL